MLTIDPEMILALLKTLFADGVSSVSFIGAGMFSTAYSFCADRQPYILRFNKHEEDFLKDEYAYRRFASPRLPIPKLVRMGRFDEDTCFAVTERCEGSTLDKIDALTGRRVAPKLFEVLAELHGLDVSNVKGWGLMDARGEGRFESWEEYLLAFHNQKFAFTWPGLLAETFLERDVYEDLVERIERLIPYCSRQKYLVHGDFGFDNVTSDGRRITGVFDWAESRLGDFIYDVAYLDFWSKEIPYGDLWRDFARARGLDVPHFEERMVCYMLHIGLGGLAIAAITDDRRSYVRTRERTRSVLTPGRRSKSDWTQ
jgi:hygromycin-B 4-O-kinase